MSSRPLNRKDFLTITISSAAIAAFLEACGGTDDPTPAGTAGTGTSGTGTAGTTAGTTAGGSASGSGTGTGGTGTAGTSTGGTGTSGSATGGSGGSGGSTGGSDGSGGATGGSGGTSGGGGGVSGGGGGGGGGKMCGAVTIMQTSNEMHDHIPDDPTKLKADLKMLYNGATPTMAFDLPMDGGNGGHSHKLTLTLDQVMMLKSTGTIAGVMTPDKDGTMHRHTYTIGCTA
jgi:hypothetical protein